MDRDPAQDEVNSLISAIREGKAIEIAYLPCQADLFGRKTDKPAKKATPGNGKPAGKAPTKAPTMPSARA
ncbi:MAG TPA: hypothetical protein VFI02_14100 [Armatimonadota bacterium]|nr:hypothetical protein [Armatimonadota bacterium]